MLIRGTLTLRNERLIAKREALGLTQVQAAALVGVPITGYTMIERLDFSAPCAVRAAKAAAFTFEIDLEEIMPAALVGKEVVNKVVRASNIEANRLLAMVNPTRFVLPSPSDEMEETEVREALFLAMDKMLTSRERGVLQLRMGLDGGPELGLADTGKRIKRSRERVRQIECGAMRKLADIRTDNPLSPFIREWQNEHKLPAKPEKEQP